MDKVGALITALSDLGPGELDDTDVETLIQLQFQCHRLLATLAVKTLGRVVRHLREDHMPLVGAPHYVRKPCEEQVCEDANPSVPQ